MFPSLIPSLRAYNTDYISDQHLFFSQRNYKGFYLFVFTILVTSILFA